MRESTARHQTSRIGEPGVARFLFGSPYASPIWLLARIYVGYLWLHAGWEKITGISGGTWTWHWAYSKDSWIRTSAGLKVRRVRPDQHQGTQRAGELRLVRLVPQMA